MWRLRPRILSLLLGAVAFSFIGFEPAPASAQTPFIPYYGKNRPRYDKFDWHIYKTDHFEIYYYPALEKHLERAASYAESAYQHISAELKYDLTSKVPLILFKTASEFQENNIIGGETPEGVLAFAEPERNRMVLPIDLPSDQLYDLITHELTHVFEFEIIPRGLGLLNNLPLWVDEGLSDYMTGNWNPLDLMSVRDLAIADMIPKMTELESAPLSGRTPYQLGHATFEFIEAKWGKDGLRQFLFSLRKNVVGGGSSAYEEALKLQPDEFDDQFDRYLKERFKPFRDKERPSDYGRSLAPRPQRSQFVATISIDPAPAGDLIAAVVGNRHDQELDIVLLSAKDGQVVTNLTEGLDFKRGFEYIAAPGGMRGNLVPWIAYSPDGERVAYFVRTEKERTLIIQNVHNKRTVRRISLKNVDGPESPVFSPDGKAIAFSAMQGAVADIFMLDLESREIRNVTKDQYADHAPTFSPDGKTMICSTRISGNDKLFQIDLTTGAKKQITFGTHDDEGPKFIDDHTIVFTSMATDPQTPIPPEVARNGNIPNIWTLDLTTAVLKQYTDVVTGNVSPVVLRQSTGNKIAFVTSFKDEYSVHAIALEKPIATVDSADFGSAGPNIDFIPQVQHTLLPDNIHKKGFWEKMSLAGRPPVNLGVTSGGYFYGNTEITFTDVLGDKTINFFAQSFNQYRTTALTYVNSERRLQYALQGFSQDTFYYGANEGILYDPALAPYVTDARDLIEAVTSQRGFLAFVIYPFNRYARAELSSGYIRMSESYNNPTIQAQADLFQQQNFGQSLFRNGNMLPLRASFIKETTLFREYGPLAGHTMAFSYEVSPAISNSWLSRQTLDADLRHYTRLAANGVFAVRLKGFKSWGNNPDFVRFGGNSELRGYDYLSFNGEKGFFFNAELRFPLIDAMLTPFGVVGGLRGVFFFNAGGAGFNPLPGYSGFKFMTRDPLTVTPIVAYQQIDAFGSIAPVYGAPVTIDGFRLVDGRASYGFGLESFLLGFPMHFDWSWKTLFNKDWEDVLYSYQGFLQGESGSQFFRRVKFSFWIGYDF